MEGEVRNKDYRWRRRAASPRYAIVAGVHGARPAAVIPASIIAEDEPASIAGGEPGIQFIDVDDLRTNHALLAEILR
jgi:hypothetical protein